MSYAGVIKKAEIVVADKGNGSFVALIKNFLGASGVAMFNPSEFTKSRDVAYAEHRIPGFGRPISQFISGGAATLQFSLLFDTWSAGLESHNLKAIASTALADPAKLSVRLLSEPITKLMEVSEHTHAPPVVSFKWGVTKFTGFMISCTEKFTMFNSVGTPVRSVVDIVLKSCETHKQVLNSPDRTKHKTVTEGDRLCSYAYEEYSSCTEWRHIADANGMDNPRLLRSGSNIVIPPI